MAKERRSKDIISEEEFNMQVATHAHTDPENDSPGDSEADAGEEFDLGLRFTPQAALADESLFDEAEEERPTEAELRARPVNRRESQDLPPSAQGISSDQPSPWNDTEASTSTH